MKTSTFFTFSTLIAFGLGALSSCVSTTTTLHLEPTSGTITKIDGRLVTKTERNGIGVVAAFEREDMEFVALDVEIKNRTDHAIDINPADFHFAALGTNQDTLAGPGNSGLTPTRTAANPTYEANRMGLKRKQESKRLKRAKVFNTVLLIAAIASDVSTSGTSRSYRDWTNNRVSHNFAYQAIAAKRAIDYSTFANRMQRYDYEEYRWRELALRQNTLAPGESVRGFIYLPKVVDAGYITLNYSLAEYAGIPLVFRQELIREKRKHRR